MLKPEKKEEVKSFYSYREIVEYVEDKYKIDLKNYKGHDFHENFVFAYYQRSDGPYWSISWDEEQDEWVEEILQIFKDEGFFAEDDYIDICID